MKSFLRESALSALFLLACLAAVVCVLALIAGCDAPKAPRCPDCPRGEAWPAGLRWAEPGENPYRAVPPMDLPVELRTANYGGGSCLYAALESVLRWQGRFAEAAWLRSNYSGAQSVDGLGPLCDRHGLRVAFTVEGDAGFLEWCSRTRRGAAIHFYTAHAVTFCGYDSVGRAVLLDNNAVDHYTRIPKDRFLVSWRGYGGRALTVVYEPAGPRPWTPGEEVGSGRWALASDGQAVGWLGQRIAYRHANRKED